MAVTDNLPQTGKRVQYVPTFRTKAGEVTALANLQAADKLTTVPVLILLPRLSAAFVADFANAWPGLPVIVDGSVETSATGSAVAFQNFFRGLGNAGVRVCPLLEPNSDVTYRAGVQQVQNQYAPGLALRVALADLANAPAFVGQLGAPPAQVDLLIDCGHVAEIGAALMAPVVTGALQGAGQSLAAWRSVTLISSAAPKDASNLAAGPNMVPRRDWQLWSAIAGNFPDLHYGDYGISHRDWSEPPGFAMVNATVTPRYSLDQDWLILKGRSTRGVNGIPMRVQYHGHAASLVAHPNFGQLPACWADDQITQLAARAGTGGSGNRETWVARGVNRHVSLVCHRLP